MKIPENSIFIIFGASGDLTYRKLIPAVYNLAQQKILPVKYSILGVSRTQISDEAFRDKMKEGIRKFSEVSEEENLLDIFLLNLNYIAIDTHIRNDFVKLKSKIDELDQGLGKAGNYLFYMAIPPLLFDRVTENLKTVGLTDQTRGYRRIIIEKPFGYDLVSSIELNKRLHQKFTEDQIYRIDHYLGKETVQNLLVTRFANGIFEPLWNSHYVHHVEITSAESIGVENRGGYYDGSGALRDMVQNHLLQMVGITAMEPPSSLEANAIRNETMKVFQSLRILKEEEVYQQVIRGQYVASTINGNQVKGYREEQGVGSKSMTETYVAIKFFIDNWRWGGVPFYIRTGKRLPTRVTEIVIHFKQTPHFLFARQGGCEGCNQLVIRIQPDEGILLKFGMKLPGAGFNVQNVNMDFHYNELSSIHIPEAYERLLHDAMIGDSTLFARADAVETAWKFVDPIQKVWGSNKKAKLYGYPAGTWGPKVADSLVEGQGLTWRYPCKNLADDGIYCEL
ncbi:MAG: glucose-6-phosphate dehydrogenase [Bacteroidales bacterium]|nr:glucose-6-phosphate dehydrogenase [Bacteroidales bacterium]